MILINLLPHREMARKKARQVFNTSLGLSALAGLAIAGGIYLWYQHQISEQQDRNAFITSEITKLDSEIKEVANLQGEIAALKARQEAVENLQADRNLPVHLMNEAVKQLPDGVYISSIKQDGLRVTMQGTAQSNERISEMLRNLTDGTTWFSRPELMEIVAKTVDVSAKEKRRAAAFTLQFNLTRASEAEKNLNPATPPVKAK